MVITKRRRKRWREGEKSVHFLGSSMNNISFSSRRCAVCNFAENGIWKHCRLSLHADFISQCIEIKSIWVHIDRHIWKCVLLVRTLRSWQLRDMHCNPIEGNLRYVHQLFLRSVVTRQECRLTSIFRTIQTTRTPLHIIPVNPSKAILIKDYALNIFMKELHPKTEFRVVI